MLHGNVDQRVKQRLRKQMRLEAKLSQLSVLRVVIVFLGFNARIRQMVHTHIEPEPFLGNAHHLREFENGKLFRELIEYPELSPGRRIQAGQLNASHRVANVEEPARLTALAINSKRMFDRSLHAKTVESGPENFVVI